MVGPRLDCPRKHSQVREPGRSGPARVGSNLAGGAHDSAGRSDPAGTRVVWAAHSLRAEEGVGPGDTQLVRLDEGS